MHSERAIAMGLRAALLGLALVLGGAVRGEAVPEHDMKAAFVFNFAVFTEWPQGQLPSGAPLAVCASPATPLFAALGQLQDKLVNGHPVALRAVAGAVQGCHVLVLDRGDRERWPQWKRNLAGSAVLTVADDRVIGGDGTMISLHLNEQRIAFDIDMAAVRGARLHLSSKLLRLARSVQ